MPTNRDASHLKISCKTFLSFVILNSLQFILQTEKQAHFNLKLKETFLGNGFFFK